MITKGELMDALEELPDDANVQIAVQRTYPFLNCVRNLCVKRDERGDAVGLVLAAGDNQEYTSAVWWENSDVTVDAAGEIIEDEED